MDEMEIESFSVIVPVGPEKFLCPGVAPTRGHSQD